MARTAKLRALRIEAWERQGYVCRWCREPLCDIETTVDHIVPIGLGGSRTRRENVVAACADCNVNRDTMTVATWISIIASDRRPVNPRHVPAWKRRMRNS